MTKALTKEKVNERLKDRPLILIGDYKNIDTKTTFRCLTEECGHEWLAIPDNVLNNHSGCPICKDTTLTKETINKRLYSRKIILIGEYVNSYTETKFQCLIDNHIWNAPVKRLLYGNSGCPKCGGTLSLNKKIVNERLADRQIMLIGSYKNTDTKTTFKCLVKGCEHEWDTKPCGILYDGDGCPKCANNICSTKENVNKRLKDRPIIMIGEYINADTKTIFKCLNTDCNNEWPATPNHVLNNKRGCPKCAKTGFDPSKPAILYYLKINHKIGEFYKIGITNLSIKKRFTKSELSIIDIIFEQKYENGSHAYNEERRLLKEYSEYRYKGFDKILKTGNSEIFTIDIFNIPC